MGRRKEITIPLNDLKCKATIIKELSADCRFSDFDLDSVTLKIQRKKPILQIKDIDGKIVRLKEYIASEVSKTIILGNYLIVERKELQKIFGVSSVTLTVWVQRGCIKKVCLQGISKPCFELNYLLKQLNEYKENLKS